MSNDGAHVAAFDAAPAAQPDVLWKIRDGKVQAAGAMVKAMAGQAGAACTRELVLDPAQGLRGIDRRKAPRLSRC